MRCLTLMALVFLSFSVCCAAEPLADQVKQKVAVVDPKTVEVWITATGKRYHRATCRYAKIQSNLKAALNRNLTPCQVCNP